MDSDICIRHKVDLERMLLDESTKPTCLALSLLEDITNCFSDDQEIGSGGFAVVYKGMVGKGMVAVKKLSKTYGMHEDKFSKEIECLMKAKHKNIVRFLGYCSDTQGRTANYEGKFVMAERRNWLLCFEYVPNGSLDKYITDASSGLGWRQRYSIIKGICEGLLHLHKKRILHLDLKPGNILLDDHMVPKIADFGLSRCLDIEQTRASTMNTCGSMGYLAPESFGGKLMFASDIYSLGVIILEILTGEKGYPEDEDVVTTWMNRLKGSDQWETQLEQVSVCIKIGIECTDSNPKKRPVARHINDRLDKTSSTIETGIRSSGKQHVSFVSSLEEIEEENEESSAPRQRSGIEEGNEESSMHKSEIVEENEESSRWRSPVAIKGWLDYMTSAVKTGSSSLGKQQVSSVLPPEEHEEEEDDAPMAPRRRTTRRDMPEEHKEEKDDTAAPRRRSRREPDISSSLGKLQVSSVLSPEEHEEEKDDTAALRRRSRREPDISSSLGKQQVTSVLPPAEKHEEEKYETAAPRRRSRRET